MVPLKDRLFDQSIQCTSFVLVLGVFIQVYFENGLPFGDSEYAAFDFTRAKNSCTDFSPFCICGFLRAACNRKIS